MKVTVTTEDFRGLEDAVSGPFEKSPTITMVGVDPKEKKLSVSLRSSKTRLRDSAAALDLCSYIF